jgi:hypothetical protein
MFNTHFGIEEEGFTFNTLFPTERNAMAFLQFCKDLLIGQRDLTQAPK